MKKTFFVFMIFALLWTGCSPAEKAPAPTPESGGAQDFGAVINATGIVVPEKWAALSAPNQGVVEEVLVTEGEQVSSGQLLVRLDGQATAQAALSAAQYELVNAQQALDTLRENADEMRAQSLIAVDETQEAYDKAVDYYDSLFKSYKYDELVFIRKVTPFGVKRIPQIKTRKIKKADEETIAEAKNDMDLKLAKLENAIRVADRTKDGPDTKLLAEAEARLDLAKARVLAAEETVTDFELRAPFNGVVCNLDVNAGEWVTPGVPLLQLGDLGNLRVETTDLSEIDAARVHPQDTVLVTFDALPEVVVNGTVLWVANKSAEGSGVNYTAVVFLDKIPASLRWGMTAFADIEVSE
ncbi:MAG: HlyD family secretion protein [Bacteroidota bacterium]